MEVLGFVLLLHWMAVGCQGKSCMALAQPAEVGPGCLEIHKGLLCLKTQSKVVELHYFSFPRIY